MTPLEELHAAHKRLSELRGLSTDGVWTVRNMDDPDGLNDGNTDDPMSPAGQGWWWVWAAQPSGYYGGVMETEGRMKSVGQTAIDDHDQGHQEHADADLIVALHRTIAAQLAILSEAEMNEIAKGRLRPQNADAKVRFGLMLARAIRGEA